MSEFDTFAVVELMGHRRTVGRVTEATIAGGEFIRVDATPLGVDPEGPSVMFYRPAAIYSITPVTEDVARREASETDVRPDWWWKHVRQSVPALAEPAWMSVDSGGEVCGHCAGLDEYCEFCHGRDFDDDDLPFSNPNAIEGTVGEPPEVDPVQEAILAEMD